MNSQYDSRVSHDLLCYENKIFRGVHNFNSFESKLDVGTMKFAMMSCSNTNSPNFFDRIFSAVFPGENSYHLTTETTDHDDCEEQTFTTSARANVSLLHRGIEISSDDGTLDSMFVQNLGLSNLKMKIATLIQNGRSLKIDIDPFLCTGFHHGPDVTCTKCHLLHLRSEPSLFTGIHVSFSLLCESRDELVSRFFKNNTIPCVCPHGEICEDETCQDVHLLSVPKNEVVNGQESNNDEPSESFYVLVPTWLLHRSNDGFVSVFDPTLEIDVQFNKMCPNGDNCVLLRDNSCSHLHLNPGLYTSKNCFSELRKIAIWEMCIKCSEAGIITIAKKLDDICFSHSYVPSTEPRMVGVGEFCSEYRHTPLDEFRHKYLLDSVNVNTEFTLYGKSLRANLQGRTLGLDSCMFCLMDEEIEISMPPGIGLDTVKFSISDDDKELYFGMREPPVYINENLEPECKNLCELIMNRFAYVIQSRAITNFKKKCPGVISLENYFYQYRHDEISRIHIGRFDTVLNHEKDVPYYTCPACKFSVSLTPSATFMT
jgi:hypothetical protein